MENEFFYTYCYLTGDAVFVQGYKNGQRIKYLIGDWGQNSKSCFLNSRLDAIKSKYKRLANYKDKIYITREYYNKYYGMLNAIFSDTGQVHTHYNEGMKFPIRYKFTQPMYINRDCDKTDIFGNPMVEIVYNMSDIRKLVMWANDNKMDLYNNIDGNVKLMDEWASKDNYHIDYNKIKIGFLDIETEMEHGQMDMVNFPERINVITLKIKKGKIYTFCLGEFKTDDTNVEVYQCVNEKQLLRCFLDKWEELDLDVISDWNGRAFDIPYIFGRCCKILGENEACRLSPFGLIEKRERTNSFGKKYDEYKIIGINHLDYMELYVNYSHTPQSSYSLNNICNYELGKGKLDYSEYGSLHKLYLNNFQKFVDYNVRDVTLLEDLDDKLQMIHLAMSIAYMCRCCFEDVYSQIRIWDSFIYSDFMKKNKVLPPKKDISDEQRGSLMGGYVKLPKKAGVFSNIVSFDVNSLYPTIIRQLNLSPDTMTDEVDERFKTLYPPNEDDLHSLRGFINCEVDCSKAKEMGMVYTCNGNFVKKDKQGFLPKMVGDLYNNRVEVKKKLKKSKQELELVKKELEKRGE